MPSYENIKTTLNEHMGTEMKKPASLARRLIAQLTGELATLANGARFANLALLLARAQLEAELWSCQGN